MSEEAVVDILETLHKRDINVKNIFIFLTTHLSAKKYEWIVDLMYKYCDFTELLADNLNDKVLVKEIVKRGKVNWFRTFCGGLTFVDLVYERTDDPEIIALVHSMLPMNSKNVSGIIRPTPRTPNNMNSVISASPTPPPIPPRTSYQRHRRMDSTSGAALEQRLWGETGPLRTDINPHSEEPVYEQTCSRGQTSSTYPIYERLYPAIPSAPPIELM
jgi:hypothetical protein